MWYYASHINHFPVTRPETSLRTLRKHSMSFMLDVSLVLMPCPLLCPWKQSPSFYSYGQVQVPQTVPTVYGVAWQTQTSAAELGLQQVSASEHSHHKWDVDLCQEMLWCHFLTEMAFAPTGCCAEAHQQHAKTEQFTVRGKCQTHQSPHTTSTFLQQCLPVPLYALLRSSYIWWRDDTRCFHSSRRRAPEAPLCPGSAQRTPPTLRWWFWWSTSTCPGSL